MKRKFETEHPDPTEPRRSKRIKEEKEKKKEKSVHDFIKEDSKRKGKEKGKGKEKEVIDEDTPGTSGLTTRKRAAEDQGGNASKRQHLEESDRHQPAPRRSTRKHPAESQEGKTTRQRHLAKSDGHQPAPEAPTSQGPAESQEAKKVFNAEELKKMQKEFEYTNKNFDEIKPSLLAFSHELYNIMYTLWPPTEQQPIVPISFFNAISFEPIGWLPMLQTYTQRIASTHSMDSTQLQKDITQIQIIQRRIVPLVDYLLASHELPGELGKICSEFVERIKGLESTRDKNERLRLYHGVLQKNRHELARLEDGVKKTSDNINTTKGMGLTPSVIQRVFSNLYIISCLLHREYPALYQEASKGIDIDKKKKIMDSYDEKLKDNQSLPDNESVVSLWETLPSVIEVLRDENTCYAKLTATIFKKQDRVSTDRVSPAGDQKPGDEEMSEEDKFRETKKNIGDIKAKLEELGSRLNGVSRIEAKRTYAQMRNLVHKKESAREVENLEGLHINTIEVLKMLNLGDIQAIQDFYTPFDARQLDDSRITEHLRPQEHKNDALEVARETFRRSLRKQRKQEVQEKEIDSVEKVVAEINQENSQKSLEAGQTPDELPLDKAADYLAKIATAGRGKAMFVFDVDQTLIPSGTDWVMPGAWIKGIERLLTLGHVVTIATGRKIEMIDEALDKAGHKGSALKDKLEICGERGSMRRGPKTHGEKILTNKRSEKYVPLVKPLMEDIKSAIHENQILNNYKKKDLALQEVPITVHALGGTILGKTFDEIQRKISEKAVQDKSINAEETFSTITATIENIVKGVLEKYPEFKADDRRLGLEIQLNPEVTGLKPGKGDAMGQVYKDYGDVSSILVFADGHIDIPMVQRAQELATLRKLLGIYLSQQEQKKRIGFLNGVLSQLQKRYDTNLTQKEMRKIVTNKNTLNKALRSLNNSAVQNYAFIAVECPRQSEELLALANIRVDGPKSAADLVHKIAINLSSEAVRKAEMEQRGDAMSPGSSITPSPSDSDSEDNNQWRGNKFGAEEGLIKAFGQNKNLSPEAVGKAEVEISNKRKLNLEGEGEREGEEEGEREGEREGEVEKGTSPFKKLKTGDITGEKTEIEPVQLEKQVGEVSHLMAQSEDVNMDIQGAINRANELLANLKDAITKIEEEYKSLYKECLKDEIPRLKEMEEEGKNHIYSENRKAIQNAYSELIRVYTDLGGDPTQLDKNSSELSDKILAEQKKIPADDVTRKAIQNACNELIRVYTDLGGDPTQLDKNSKDEAKSNFAVEKAVTLGFLGHWQEKVVKEEQLPSIEGFEVAHKLAQAIVNIKNMNDIAPEHLEHLEKINEIFKEAAEEDPKQFLPDLKQALVRARELISWATSFQERFDLDEDWVKAGVNRLGIEVHNFYESYQSLLMNGSDDSDKIFDESHPMDNIRADYEANKADKIVPTYENFMRVKASLDYINSQLRDGIPVDRIPKRIWDREVTYVSGAGYDCLTRSILTGAHPEWPPEFIEAQIGKAKAHVVEWLRVRVTAYEEKVKELKGQGCEEDEAKEKAADELEIYDVENLKVSHTDMLNAGGDTGDRLIFYLRTTKVMDTSTNEEVPLLDPDRPILTYQYRDRRMQCTTIEPLDPGSSRDSSSSYAMLRDDDNEHFYAILPKGYYIKI